MIKVMKILAFIGFISILIFAILYYLFSNGILLAFAITAGTFTYHFAVRLVIGYTVDGICKNKVDYNKKWFKQKAFEERLYNLLKVKNWKAKMPTAAPDSFDMKRHTASEIASAMCQAEIVHEIIIVASFLPIIATVWFGEFWVFFITSLLSACYDLVFVIIQRFNRPRILKIAEKLKVRSKGYFS